MSGTAIAPVFQLGPRITAQVLGLPFSQYRPSGVTSPIVSGNLVLYPAAAPVNTIPAWITGDKKLMAATPIDPTKGIGFAAIDPALTQPGDYLVGSVTVGGTALNFFIASQDVPAPIEVIRCSRVVSVSRMQSAAAPGISPVYGGDVLADQIPVITGWPASLLNMGSKGAPNLMQLPNDSKMGTMSILLPASVPVTLYANDLVTDDLGNAFAVSAAELTATGWRLTVDQWKQG